MAVEPTKKKASGYHGGAVDTVISVEDVNRQAKAIAETVTKDQIMDLVEGEPFLQLEELRAGYGKMEILHGIDLARSARASRSA